MRIARFLPPAQAEAMTSSGRLRRRMERWLERNGRRLGAAGVPPALLRHRWRQHVPAAAVAHSHTIHPALRFRAPLPFTVDALADLPAEPGWWGFSFRDVPNREVGPTRLLRFSDVRVLAGLTADGANTFFPALLDRSGRSLDLREINFRPFHGPLVTRSPALILDRALWIAERVFDNYAHWFSAHLPKLVLLRNLGEWEELVLPERRPVWMDASLERIGIGKGQIVELPRGGVLAARSLLVVDCDRFRPELLKATRSACAEPSPSAPSRRIFLSRRQAQGRRLLNEEALLPMLEAHGFEPVVMEQLDLAAQIRLMAETKILLAPHGAGLTNMLFCPADTCILEMADPTYPNPNFYAMASALGHMYACVPACGVGDRHPLRQDLFADEVVLQSVLARWL